MPQGVHNRLVKALHDSSRSKPALLFGFGALILGVIGVPVAYEFSPKIKAALLSGAILSCFFALVAVLAALKADR
jgi:hypothetical protein